MSSSSSFDSSSTSSESNAPKVELYSVVIVQGHNDLMPFSFVVEDGFVDTSIISFTISGESSIGVANANVGTVSTTCVVETLDSKYKHEPFTYVDIMVKDASGVKEVSARSQVDLYQYEEPQYTFNIPKFSWDNNIFGDDGSSESSQEQGGFVWFGTSTKKIYQIGYTPDYTYLQSYSNATSEVNKILFNQYNSDVYISGYDDLSRYISNNYWKDVTEINKYTEIANSDEDLIVYGGDNNRVVSLEAYSGKMIIRDRETLAIISEYSGFDAPFKATKSTYHNCYLVAGTNILWKVTDAGIKTPIYEIKDYTISDFDCSENGEICIVFNNTSQSLIRIIDKDFYKILFNKTETTGNANFCKYCGKGIFYILVEIPITNGLNYQTTHYVFDVNKDVLTTCVASNNVATTTTTTTLGKPSAKVQMITPNGGEIWQRGTTQVIKWASSASVKDEVSIELYKGIKRADVLTSNNANSGTFSWKIASSYAVGSDYKIRVNWLSASDTQEYGISNSYFTITDAPVTTTTTTTRIRERAIGIDYSEYNNYILVVLSNGLIGIFDLNTITFSGLLDSGIRGVTCMGIKDGVIRKYPTNNKVRIFVGSAPYLNNMWDSGEVTTNLNSMYYGSSNLVPGEKYYVNLMVYSENSGWSEIQSKEWIMPK